MMGISGSSGLCCYTLSLLTRDVNLALLPPFVGRPDYDLLRCLSIKNTYLLTHSLTHLLIHLLFFYLLIHLYLLLLTYSRYFLAYLVLLTCSPTHIKKYLLHFLPYFILLLTYSVILTYFYLLTLVCFLPSFLPSFHILPLLAHLYVLLLALI